MPCNWRETRADKLIRSFRDDTWSIMEIMNTDFRDIKSPIAAYSTSERLWRPINAVVCTFFCCRGIGLVNEREMDVWIEAIMARFLLILPLLASLRHLIHPIGKWSSFSRFVRRKMHQRQGKKRSNWNVSLSNATFFENCAFAWFESIINDN